MKTYLFCFLLFFCFQSFSQGRFVRIYDAKNNKIAKGKIVAVNDTSLQMFSSTKRNFSVPIASIDYILTCRSGGHNVGMGALIGGIGGMVLGAATANPEDFLGYTETEGLGIGLVCGGVAGVVIGGMTVMMKGPERVEIHGDRHKIQEYLSRY